MVSQSEITPIHLAPFRRFIFAYTVPSIMANWLHTDNSHETVVKFKIPDRYHSNSPSNYESWSENLSVVKVRCNVSRLFPCALQRFMRMPVLEATSNDTRKPTQSQMAWIARMTIAFQLNHGPFHLIMMQLAIKFRCVDVAWRSAFKALIVLEYLLLNGSRDVAVYWTNEAWLILLHRLEDFECVENKKNVGMEVRMKAKDVLKLLLDEEKLGAARAKSKPRGTETVNKGDTANTVDIPRKIPTAPIEPSRLEAEEPRAQQDILEAELVSKKQVDVQEPVCIQERLAPRAPPRTRSKQKDVPLSTVYQHEGLCQLEQYAQREGRFPTAEEVQCPVCLAEDQQVISKTLISLKCGHLYCEGCVDQLSGICAMCRKAFDKEEVVKLFL